MLDIQSALWNSGLMRAAGPIDILIAGYAIGLQGCFICCSTPPEGVSPSLPWTRADR